MDRFTPLAVAFVCVVACVCDVRTRRIPNLLTFGAAVAAVITQLVAHGLFGAGYAVAGWAVGAAIFLPLFALAGMGAGDVKLLAAMGAWLGPRGAVWAALLAAIAGGLMAVAVAMVNGYLVSAFRNIGTLLRSWWLGGIRPVPHLTLEQSRGPRLAYALPIAAGALVTLWML